MQKLPQKSKGAQEGYCITKKKGNPETCLGGRKGAAFMTAGRRVLGEQGKIGKLNWSGAHSAAFGEKEGKPGPNTLLGGEGPVVV